MRVKTLTILEEQRRLNLYKANLKFWKRVEIAYVITIDTLIWTLVMAEIGGIVKF